MANFLLNEENLNSQAGKMLELAGDLKTRIAAVDDAIAVLVESVHGNASVNCSEQWNTAKEAMLTYVPKMEEVAGRLSNAATATSSVDAELTDGLKVEAEARA